MSADIPQGWHEFRLEDCVEVLDSLRVPVNNDERQSRIEGKPTEQLFPYYGATGQVGFIDDFLFDEELVALGEDGVPFLDPLKSKAYMLRGKTWVNNHAHVLRSLEGVAINKFVFYYLNQFDYQGYVNGGTRLKLTQANMRMIPVPLPPLAEQTRIAQKLDELLAQVDTLKARLDAIPALLKRFRQSTLAAAVSGRLTADWRLGQKGLADEGSPTTAPNREAECWAWPKSTLKSRITGIEQGWSPKCGSDSVTKTEKDWAVIKTTSIQPIDFYPLENKRLPVNLSPRPELSVRAGDLLITRAGPRSRAAICCYVKKTQSNLMICDKAYRFRPHADVMDGRLLCLFLNSPQYMSLLDDLKTGISESGMNLTMRKFQELPIPLPPLAEQTEIVRRVEQLFAFTDQLEGKIKTAQARVNHLTQSILAKAFRGELVLQDPNDEPASELLARIQAQRAAAPKAKRGRKASA